ncbi:hypothetical protein BD626DRAFT_465218, partial [Schizophyllum amplum]
MAAKPLPDLPASSSASSQDSTAPADPLAALWHQAISSYRTETGVNLCAEGNPRLDSESAIHQYLDDHQQKFHDFRDGGAIRLREALAPVVAACSPLCTVAGEGLGMVFEPSKVVFAAVGELCKAAVEARDDLDAISDAFDTMAHHLRIVKPVAARDVLKDDALREASVKLLAQILVVLGVIQKVRKQGRLVLWLKKLAKSKEVSSALADLSRLASNHHETVTAVTLYTAKETMAILTESDACNREEQAVIRMSLGSISKIAQDIHAMVRERSTLTLDQQNANRGILESIQRTLLQQVSHMGMERKTADVEKLFAWLQYPDCSVRMNNLLDNRAQSTGSWFLDGEEFTAFKKGTTKSLWLHGKGTVFYHTLILHWLIAAGIQDLQASCGATSLTLTHLFDTTGSSPRNVRALLSALLCQLAYNVPDCAAQLLKLSETASTGNSQPSLRAMRHNLDVMLTDTHLHLFIVVDALDEADDPAVIPVLANLQTYTNVSLMVSSRYEVIFREDLEAAFDSQVAMDQDRVTGDINSLLAALMTKGGLLDKITDTNLVQETLSSEADGNFRWVVLQVRELVDVAGIPAQVRRRLKMLPGNLGDVYDRLLASIHAAAQENVRILLMWAILTEQPLSTAEFAELLSFDYSERMPVYDASLRPSADHVLALAGSTFVAVQDGQVRIAHASVKDYLLALPSTSPFFVDKNLAYCLMARTGLAYIGSIMAPADAYPSHLAWIWVDYISQAGTDHRAELEQDAGRVIDTIENSNTALAASLHTAAEMG